MDPTVYVPRFLERLYLSSHPDLTPAARELVHADVAKNPERYATTDHAKALISYSRVHSKLMTSLDRMDELSDEEFETERNKLFDRTGAELQAICAADRLCIDAELLTILLADTPIDPCLSDLMKLESKTRGYLSDNVDGLDLDPDHEPDAPHFWKHRVLIDGATAAELTASEPTLIGWLHTLEAISYLSLASARYRAALHYSQIVMRAEGYPNRAVGTELLAYARLEDENAFFDLARKHPDTIDGKLEDSPWYLLGRTILLYKTDKMKSAARALRELVGRCDGAAYFLLNPTYMCPYLPVRPAPRESWDLSRQALWEADSIIADTPDFAVWAESVDGVAAASEAFAQRNGF